MRVLAAAAIIGLACGRVLMPFEVQEVQADCNCDWTSQPGACNPPGDGSVCWNQCCGGGGNPDCNCNWIHIPGACNPPGDGSKCWGVCCHGPQPVPTPTPVPDGPTPAPGKGIACNLVDESNNSNVGNGFSRQGGMRYHSQEKLDLLGGGLSFTVDLSRVNNMVNANLYLVIPGTLQNSHFYCDNSQPFVDRGNACIELDIFESNGHQLAASTMHTHIGTNSGCDTWGCRQMVYFGGTIDGNRPFQINVAVSNDGDLTVQFSQNGKSQWAFNHAGGWDGAAKQAVVDGMRNHGAVVVSSMWTGWVPPNNSGKGDLGGSHYTLSDLKYTGRSKGHTM